MVTIEQLFRQAQQAGAAEIYLMAGRKPAARIGGKIKNLDYPELSSTEAEKILLEMLDAKQAAQYRETKSVDEVIAFHGIGRFRVHIYQNDGVPSACVKIINKKEGLPEELKALAEQMLAGRFMHLVTLESPVEYPIEAGKGLLSRRCIGKDTGSYKEGMDNLLHESADGVLIGELETPEAVQAALRAAKMGLVVLGTVNSVDADTAVERIAQLSGMEAPLQKTRVWKITKAVIQQKYELCESTGKFVYNCEILKNNS